MKTSPDQSAARAANALAAYALADQRPVDLMTDFLPDLMHWCASQGLDWDDLAKRAKAYVAEETNPPHMPAPDIMAVR